MGAIDRLRSRETTEVAVGDLRFRLRRVSPADVAAYRHAMLAVVPVEVATYAPVPGASREDDMRSAQRVLQSMSDADVRLVADRKMALLRAAVVGVADEGGEWEPCRLVTGEPSQDGDLPISALYPHELETLYEECAAWQVGGEEGRAALATFRRLADGAGDDRPTGEALQPDAG